jgi:hypothetical protein
LIYSRKGLNKKPMKYMILGILAVAGIYSIHRLALWAEERAWIYYRKKGGGSGTLGNALLELQTFLEPSKRHILDEHVKKDPDAQDSGDKPKTGI